MLNEVPRIRNQREDSFAYAQQDGAAQYMLGGTVELFLCASQS
jgi:hypothetical protein